MVLRDGKRSTERTTDRLEGAIYLRKTKLERFVVQRNPGVGTTYWATSDAIRKSGKFVYFRRSSHSTINGATADRGLSVGREPLMKNSIPQKQVLGSDVVTSMTMNINPYADLEAGEATSLAQGRASVVSIRA
ncbi:hypothetical protein KIN20_000581 [Parelaphostrongylus tenuis]|uniref:Uncharacterized protein n=1 Tax=Parelaphostrongylus tenuis TaxID=148309 RepID=A0AAD5QDZ4_PARTN|nr:hypothetical protein KIN20_000581 [Parelaphostrongylus tenuis]